MSDYKQYRMQPHSAHRQLTYFACLFFDLTPGPSPFRRGEKGSLSHWERVGVRDFLLSQQSLLSRHADGRVAGFDAELIVDRTEVSIHCAAADDEPRGDLRVAQFFGEQAEHLDFARRQHCAGN